MSLAKRSITSASWNLTTNLAKVVILLTRSILLARLLPVDTFGVYALAFAVVTFTGILARFGTSSAFLHRASETSDVDRAAGVHLTLRLLLTSVWALTLIVLSSLLTSGDLQLALIWLTLAVGGTFLTDIPRYVLNRQVNQRRLAVIDLVDAVLSTVVALVIAVYGSPIVALLATDAVSLAVNSAALYGWNPVWRPHLVWDRVIARYYLHFGRAAAADDALNETLDNLDELWTGAVLGPTALGYYSRAFTFATYPRRILASPLHMVSGGTYAELKGDRPRLSRAFTLSNAWLIRGGFLFSGLFFLIAPEFVRLALGEKWLPMVPAFRLMIVFALLDPIRSSLGGLFAAVGRPEQIIGLRLVQLAVLVPGLVIFGGRWGITGVAVAMDLMTFIGMGLLFARARKHVDFSVAALFFVPLLSLILAGAVAFGIAQFACSVTSGSCPSDWTMAILKAVAFGSVFSLTIYAFERREIVDLIRTVQQSLSEAAGRSYQC